MPIVDNKGKKEATRGQKQIVAENKETIKFYTIMSSVATTVFVIASSMLFSEGFTSGYVYLTLFAVLIHVSCVSTMRFMARATYSTETGQLVDGGIDLNMTKGFAEYLKDLVILTSSTQGLSLISDYFWWLLLLVPVYAFYLLWTNLLGPWFFAPAPEVDEEVNEKKQKKLDRRMRRTGGR